MNGIDLNELDEAIAKTFGEVRTAVNAHNEKSLHMYSAALRALVELRREVTPN
ncbi:hypothetical protein [Streptomyces sp. NBC_01408]|uniref:hypothetical protein n=1 Tax=Streptomyces sp. NBC_01408 TaxID=2903855 RepID=UPI0022506FCB|nr:hypothetical protein [Streptomyces sp. NBC_01408]MCX4692721.1 hypothetical protein [Streptomyces sp. NBC_01408]